MDPLSLLSAKKKEELASTKKVVASPLSSPPSATDPADVFGALGGRPNPGAAAAATSSLFGGPPLLVSTPAAPVQASSGGYPSRSTPGAAVSTPDEDPFRVTFASPTNGSSGGSYSSGSYGGGTSFSGGSSFHGSHSDVRRDEVKDAAKAAWGAAGGSAWGAAGGAASSAFSAVGGLLRGGSTTAATPSSGSNGAPGAGLASLASSAAASGGGPPGGNSSVPVGTTFEDILPGEKVHVIVKSCYLVVANPLCELHGRLLVTNYRLKFQTPKGTLREELQWMREVSYFDVPMGTIEDIKDEKSVTAAGAIELKLKVSTKDFRTLVLLPKTEEDIRSTLQAVAAFGVPGNPTLLFAFKHAEAAWESRSGIQDIDGWTLYNPVQEYTRMGIETDLMPSPSSPWRMSKLNSDYGLCTTYPAVLAFPRNMSDQELRAVARFRKRGRLPSMSWCGGPELEYASLWRCSQTTEGLMGQKCNEDAALVECIRQGWKRGEADRDLLVIDLRPWKSAWANKAGGGGFEGYAKCRLVFGGIDNIHCVRDAWRAMGAAVANVTEGESGTWFKDVANSSWYDYLGAILGSCLKVVKEILEHRSSVMVHCSDGWDRTAEATSLSMLCLDPYYRTQAGFLLLIQKEWCSFGHRFRTRLALGEPPSGEFSPVFIQWLECVYQIVQYTPNAFEFSTSVLIRLAHEAFTNRYGTFLCDNERERSEKVSTFALSFWSILLRPEESITWRNPDYKPDRAAIVPNICQANYVIWEDYWWRHSPRGLKAQLARTSTAAAAPPSAASTPPPAASVSFDAEAAPASAAPPLVTEAAGGGDVAREQSVEALQAASGSLFSSEVLTNGAALPPAAPPQPRAPAKQVFADDDDEDPFALPGKRLTEKDKD
mmetsp:Transcript_149823/g.481246  ORF Transcript_149823/g.481246 Transcript_149823/m.481246 type:complete len:883 (-) Transcript_149823:252-2900(-)